ncbi:MAG: tRNA (guanine10-N2)-dimethyltransferase [Thermoplasmata archaeon]|nr:tRNA (guanine10-N2)-dimethyltransferase [Thermoplasmata archaeon]
MLPRLVLLSGEHATLPAAELRALLAVHDADAQVALDGLVATVTPAHADATDAALGRMALAHEWGEHWASADDTPEGIAALAAAVAWHAPGKLPAAVTSERRGLAKSANSIAIERRLGKALADAGHPIDLKAPHLTVFAWIVDGRVLAGLLRGRPDRSAFEARVAEKRAHFSPVSLHPRRAASLLHLARVPPGGTLYDPFCGTGTFVLEAALEGYRAWGSDLDAWMVQGTWQTLTDVPPEPLDATVFEADIGAAPDLVGQVDGLVTDLPYGRASGTDGEALAALYERAFAAFAALLPPGRHAVVGHPDPALLAGIEAHGFAVAERHEERAHRSLTRHFAVLRRL